MKINAAGLKLVEDSEGFRGRAYRCPAGIWTIGHGHTSMAGPPPVKSGMTMTESQARAVLARDLETFSHGVKSALKRDLTDNQFSALVSFAYNVGLGAFRGSSVLRAVNAGQDELVPRRLAQWSRAGGRTLPGLVKRRHAEALLYLTPEAATLISAILPRFSSAERREMDAARGMIDAPTGTPLRFSTTAWASVTSAAAGIYGAVESALWRLQDFTSVFTIPPRTYVAMTAIVIIGTAAFWIIRERQRHAEDDDV